MTPAPLTGTVTMLFTDIERSTVLLRQLGSRWGEALNAHREIVRAAVAETGGEEMGMEGDSFFVVFGSAHQAVRAAVTAQRGLDAYTWPEGHDLRVRMGLHTGEPERHVDGYIGEDVHVAARIGATAHGGQVVVSETTRRLVDLGGGLDGVAFRDLGRHRLKDIDGDTHLYDLVIPGLSSTFPPLRSLGRRAALPTPRTALVGRDEEVAQVVRLVADGARLLTLTGPGGCGKTRIALAVAAQLEDAYPGGVYFVALDGVDTAETMARVVADALDAPAGRSDRERLVLQLADRQVLLVLDNLEQIQGAEQVVGDLLDVGAGVAALATSRRPLLLAGEQELPVSPLALPVSSAAADLDASAAVELYVRTARLVRPGFALTPENREDVATLVRQLDGLPLAIELAAANARLLGPAALVSRLDLRLGSGVTAADRPDRHRTLGRTIEWSYDLLDPADQVAFRRLGVFRGPVTLDAVGAVVGEPRLLDSVGSLVTSSLVQVTGDPEPRLRMLETIRRFAVEQLEAAGELDGARRRHLAWCQAEVDRLVEWLRGPKHPMALDGLGAVDADVQGALEWALSSSGDGGDDRADGGGDGRAGGGGDGAGGGGHKRGDGAGRGGDGAGGGGDGAGGGGDGAGGGGDRAWGRRAAAAGVAADADRVRGAVGLVVQMTRYWYRFSSSVVARRWQELALSRLDGLPGEPFSTDSEATVTLLHQLAISMLQHGDTEESLSVVERSLAMAERLGRVDLQSRALVDLGIALEQLCRPEEAIEVFGRASALARESGDQRFVALSEANTALAYFDLGRYDEAIARGWRSLEQRTSAGDRWAACIDRLNLLAALLLGEGPSSAYRWFVEWTPEILALRDAQLAVNLVEVGAGIAAAVGSAERAARLAGCADARRSALTMRRTAEDDQQLGRFLEPALAALGAASFAAARAEGASLSVADALELVTSLRVVPAG